MSFTPRSMVVAPSRRARLSGPRPERHLSRARSKLRPAPRHPGTARLAAAAIAICLERTSACRGGRARLDAVRLPLAAEQRLRWRLGSITPARGEPRTPCEPRHLLDIVARTVAYALGTRSGSIARLGAPIAAQRPSIRVPTGRCGLMLEAITGRTAGHILRLPGAAGTSQIGAFR